MRSRSPVPTKSGTTLSLAERSANTIDGSLAELREPDIARLKESVGTASVVTVVGVAGVGKMHLAFEVGRAYPSTLLLDAREWDGFAVATSALWQALGGAADDIETLEGIAEHLASFDLLILAGFEADIAKGVVAALTSALRLMGGATGMVVTRTAALNVPGEIIHHLDPLSLDHPQEELSPSARFLKRAITAHAGPDAVGDDASLEAIAQHLGGIPMELAAAAPYIALIGADEAARHLDTVREAWEKEGTLIGAFFEASWPLVSEVERQALHRLSVAGGRASTELLAAWLGLGEEEVESLLGSLRNKSWILDTSGGTARLIPPLVRFIRSHGGADEDVDLRPSLRAAVCDVAKSRIRRGDPPIVSEDLTAFEMAVDSLDDGRDALLLAYMVRPIGMFLHDERRNLLERLEVRAALALGRDVARILRALRATDFVNTGDHDIALSLLDRPRPTVSSKRTRANLSADAEALEGGVRCVIEGVTSLSAATHQEICRHARAMPSHVDSLIQGLIFRGAAAIALLYDRYEEAIDLLESAAEHTPEWDARPQLIIKMRLAATHAERGVDLDAADAAMKAALTQDGTGPVEYAAYAQAMVDFAAGRLESAEELARQYVESGEARVRQTAFATGQALLSMILAARGEPDPSALVVWETCTSGYIAAGLHGEALIWGSRWLLALHAAAKDAEAQQVREQLKKLCPVEHPFANELFAAAERVVSSLDGAKALRLPLDDITRASPIIRSFEAALVATIAEREQLGALPAPSVPITLDGSEHTIEVGSQKTTLSRHALLRRLLAALLEVDGEAVSSDALIAAGWPDERIIASAASNRLRVAIAKLRGMGLREVLETEPGGYRLSLDGVRVVHAPGWLEPAARARPMACSPRRR